MLLPRFLHWRLFTAAGILVLAGCRAGAAGSAIPPAQPENRQAAHARPGALDPAIVVANFSGSDILEFALDAHGNQAPRTVISGKKTKIDHADNVALNKNDHIFATINGDEIAIYAANAHGDAAPIGKIAGSNTQITFPIGVAVDSNGFVYEGDCGTGKVNVFAPGTKGNVAPLRQISFASCVIELALDATDHLYVASGDNLISEYSPGNQGNSPLRTIDEKEATGGIFIRSIAVDSHGYIYAGNLGAHDIRVYARSASGYADPVRTIHGSQTRLGAPTGLALDKPSDNLYVTVCEHCSHGSGSDSILIFKPRADGNVKPTTVIAGAKTTLDAPTDLTLRQ